MVREKTVKEEENRLSCCEYRTGDVCSRGEERERQEETKTVKREGNTAQSGHVHMGVGRTVGHVRYPLLYTTTR